MILKICAMKKEDKSCGILCLSHITITRIDKFMIKGT